MLKTLTESAWGLYLRILDIERVADFSKRIDRLADRAYRRYIRRRDALGLHRETAIFTKACFWYVIPTVNRALPPPTSKHKVPTQLNTQKNSNIRHKYKKNQDCTNCINRTTCTSFPNTSASCFL